MQLGRKSNVVEYALSTREVVQAHFVVTDQGNVDLNISKA